VSFAMADSKTKIFKALSDPNRVRILKILQARPLYACEVREILDLAGSTVSKHLSILKESGFIVIEKEGKWINFKINPNPSDQRISSILSSLDFWIADNDTIINDLKNVSKVDRFQICAK
jgi:ArsR family transcriptional regulator